MKLYLTGEPCTQQRHCYFVEGESASFIMDCGYQRCYRGDEANWSVTEIKRTFKAG